ncbi:hypothetical protein [Paenibacillus polymyxa]|nr:hypothetical protein [Paenibacillus polymyxa]
MTACPGAGPKKLAFGLRFTGLDVVRRLPWDARRFRLTAEARL